MNGINKLGVRRIQTDIVWHSFDVPSSRIQTLNNYSNSIDCVIEIIKLKKVILNTCNSAEVGNLFARISCSVRSETVSNQMNIRCFDSEFFLFISKQLKHLLANSVNDDSTYDQRIDKVSDFQADKSNVDVRLIVTGERTAAPMNDDHVEISIC